MDEPLIACKTCSFYEVSDDTHGWCRFNPPVEDLKWPVVDAYDWCGKHKNEVEAA